MSETNELQTPIDNEEVIMNDVDTKESEPSGLDPFGMMKNFNDIANAFEMQRQLVDARGRLEELGYVFGIGKDDMEFLHNNMSTKEYTEPELRNTLSDLDSINKTFFTRDDGTIINIKQSSLGESEFEVKKDLISYLVTFYTMERDLLKDIDSINQEIKGFYSEDISGLGAQIANSLKSSIAARRNEANEMEDGEEKTKRLSLLSAMENAYTFKIFMDIIEKYPSIVENTLSDIKHPQQVKDTGMRYKAKRKQARVASTLYSVISDDISKSLEKQFLCQDDYVEGYENLFGFYLIRFFSKEDWGSKTAYTKEMHNATVIVLSTMLSGNLDKEFRDEVCANMAKVWKKFKDHLMK